MSQTTKYAKARALRAPDGITVNGAAFSFGSSVPGTDAFEWTNSRGAVSAPKLRK